MKAEPSDPLEVGVTSEVSGKLPQVRRVFVGEGGLISGITGLWLQRVRIDAAF